ncbi:MAG TPA: DUF4012 domain-containing protein [Ktedonobacteraceae bacterium]|nr:DUF4012 domain-containing protein [Ktedonobacteraceae bacterium]
MPDSISGSDSSAIADTSHNEANNPHPPETEPALAVPKKRRPRTKRQRIIIWSMLAILLVSIIIPATYTVNYGLNAYTTYNALRNQAYSGMQHLLNVKTIFTGLKSHPTGYLDTTKLHSAQKEFTSAQQDFSQLQYTLDHAGVIQNVTQYLPQYRTQITTARAASQIGMDVATIGTKLVQTALVLAPTFHGSLLTTSSQPLVTPATLTLIGSTIDYLLPLLNDIQLQSRQLDINALPVSASSRAEFVQLLQLLPQATANLAQVHNLLGGLGWMLGVGQPRTFLVQTMDRAELRPTGGFTGQYGELHINGGRVAPFSLHDISFVEYTNNSPTIGQPTPTQYRSWWPFANWGLRDSNLSADFPTSAQIAMNLYKLEVGHSVDGVILFTPILIEHILNVIGPMQIPSYHETITAQNLEERLHYYQLDNAGIRKEELVQHVTDPAAARKLFTALVAQTLLDQVRHAPPDELLAIASEMLHDLKTKDLQVYVNNPQVEGLLTQYGDAAQIDRSTTHDGLFVVQTNESASKASQYVRTIEHDTVTLDAHGGATHTLQLRLVYSQLGTVYGYDTYSDYVRVYVPPTSKLLYSDGFDTGVPLCGGAYVACPQYNVYPKDELLCPAGQFQPGAAAPSITDPNGGNWHPLDTVGPATNTSSDMPGRAMFAGLVVVPKNCTMTVTLSWYVPPMGQHPYSLLIQRQAGTFPEASITILPSPGACSILRTQGLYFDGILTEDTTFTPKQFSPSSHVAKHCYPQPGT